MHNTISKNSVSSNKDEECNIRCGIKTACFITYLLSRYMQLVVGRSVFSQMAVQSLATRRLSMPLTYVIFSKSVSSTQTLYWDITSVSYRYM